MDVNVFAASTSAAWPWSVAAKKPNGSPKAWAARGVRITEARTHAGFLCFKVKFADGTHFHAATLAEAQDYAERNTLRPYKEPPNVPHHRSLEASQS